MSEKIYFRVIVGNKEDVNEYLIKAKNTREIFEKVEGEILAIHPTDFTDSFVI